jgi:hypothetical protein
MFPRTGPLWKQTPIFRALLSVSFGVPSTGVLPPGSLHRTPSERHAPFLRPPFVFQSPRYTSGLPVSPAGSLWSDSCPSPEPSTHTPGPTIKEPHPTVIPEYTLIYPQNVFQCIIFSINSDRFLQQQTHWLGVNNGQVTGLTTDESGVDSRQLDWQTISIRP